MSSRDSDREMLDFIKKRWKTGDADQSDMEWLIAHVTKTNQRIDRLEVLAADIKTRTLSLLQSLGIW